MDTREIVAAERRDGPSEEATLPPCDPDPKAAKPKTAEPKSGVRKEKEKKKKAKASKKYKKAKAKFDSDSDSDSSSSSSSSSTSSSSDSSDSDSDSDSESEAETKKKRASNKRFCTHKLKKKAKAKKGKKLVESGYDDDEAGNNLLGDERTCPRSEEYNALRTQIQVLQNSIQTQLQPQHPYSALPSLPPPPPQPALSMPPLIPPPPVNPRRVRSSTRFLRDSHPNGQPLEFSSDTGSPRDKGFKHGKARKNCRLDYKRVDQVWDTNIHNFKLQDTAEAAIDAQYDEFIFHVRRTFDWEGKYKATIVDIKSKPLRDCLQEVMGNIKGVSLVDDTPNLDPNMLFLHLDDFKLHCKALKKRKSTADRKSARKKEQKKIEARRQHLKILVKYLDKDYAQIKDSLYPMLENGLITFDLLWALWKPNTLAYTTTYGSHDEPRVFKVECAEKDRTLLRGEYYYVEGKYFEFDGKQFGFGSMSVDVEKFRGARKITSLACYPLKYHKNQDRLRQDLIERGKMFVSLSGVHYKSHQGMAYMKKKKGTVKVNINGRVMIDPAIHRRINPNYPISIVRPKSHDIIGDDSGDEGGCFHDLDSDQFDRSPDDYGDLRDGDALPKYVIKDVLGPDGDMVSVPVLKDELDGDAPKEKLDRIADKNGDATDDKGKPKSPPEFTDEEYLIASPVVLGFAFAEKLWLEFTVSGVKEIHWNEHAYESLVLEAKTKDIVKALVESHKYHAAESIDDVIQGKGKGLVAVLHGPPGTGKTLTAEGISELLKCPLYMASAGELGTDSRYLEAELQKILDICHAWGAILLLDEADVFMEKRNMHDIHRNAMVSIFLRQLEYFQGILFLTTNRVETFDDAFQSRIHIALRYDSLDLRAKRAIFKLFIERVRSLEQVDHTPFTEEDYTTLAKHELNGRQIKNTVRTAQALAVNKGEPLSMNHIRQVLDVHLSFDRDLKGGTGYQDAMRSYF